MSTCVTGTVDFTTVSYTLMIPGANEAVDYATPWSMFWCKQRKWVYFVLHWSLYLKAYRIHGGNRSQNLFLRLGGFHQLMSFHYLVLDASSWKKVAMGSSGSMPILGKEGLQRHSEHACWLMQHFILYAWSLKLIQHSQINIWTCNLSFWYLWRGQDECLKAQMSVMTKDNYEETQEIPWTELLDLCDNLISGEEEVDELIENKPLCQLDKELRT